MRAIVQDKYGPPDILQLADIDTPSPNDDEVLVRVRAAGVGPAVWHLMAGEPYLVRVMGFGLRKPKARVPGTDVAGAVEAVGANVSEFQPGDEVFGMGEGAFAEFARVPVDKLLAKPAALTFEQAAAVPDSGSTALKSVRDVGEVQAGQKVLVVGAAGGVGTYAVQIARALDAVVTGVCSTSKTELVASIGAARVIDYTREDFADGSETYDVILDIAGRRPLSHLRRALAPEGTLVLVGGEGGGRWFGGMNRQLGAVLRSRFARQTFKAPIFPEHSKDDLRALKELIDAGKVTPVMDRAYPLNDAADAISYWAEGHARGKVVITM